MGLKCIYGYLKLLFLKRGFHRWRIQITKYIKILSGLFESF